MVEPTGYRSEFSRINETTRRMREELPNLALKIKTFETTLSSYHIPQDGIEKYSTRFGAERSRLVGWYISQKILENPDALIGAEVIREIAFVEVRKPGEVELKDLTPLQRDYLDRLMKIEIELLDGARREYLPAKPEELKTPVQDVQPPKTPDQAEESLQERMNRLLGS